MDETDSYRPLGLSRNDVLTMLSIGVVVISAYLPAIQGGFIWDDGAHVTKPDLRSLHGLWRIWFEVGATQQYYPCSTARSGWNIGSGATLPSAIT